MTSNRLVSVIIPVYNSAKYIAGAIGSVLVQTYKDYEIIIVDDGSTDGTAEIVKQYIRPQTIDHRSQTIKYIYQENKGPSAARNRGIKEARGEYIAFLDSDDEWLPGKLEKQINLLTVKHNVGLVTCGRKIIDQSKNEITSLPQIPDSRQKLLTSFVFGNTVGSCSCVMLRKSCIDAIGYFDESLKVGEDWDLWLRIARVFDVTAINEPLVRYHVRPDCQSNSGNVNLENELRLLQKVFNDNGIRYTDKIKQKAYSYRYYKAAIAYKENDDIPKMREAILKSLQLYPLHIFNKAILSFTLKSMLS